MKKLFIAIFMISIAIPLTSYGSNSTVIVYKIGDRGPAGGWIFYDKGNNSDGWRYLEAAPEDQSKGIQWSNIEDIKTRAFDTAIGSGKKNTQIIIETLGDGIYAAKICVDYRGGGKSDWFLPSKDELKLMCWNLRGAKYNCNEYNYNKQTIYNPNVPDAEKGGIGEFICENCSHSFWSSTGAAPNYAWSQYFYHGWSENTKKNIKLRVRAIRAF